jgi:F-type H+-transporting ATPase subunit a
MGAIVFAACWFNFHHVPHHQGNDPFMLLFAHLNPEKLLKDPGAGHHGDDSFSHDESTGDESTGESEGHDEGHDAGQDEHGAGHGEHGEGHDEGHDEHGDSHDEDGGGHGATADGPAGEHGADGHAASPYVFSLTVPVASSKVVDLLDMDQDTEGFQLVMMNLQIFQIAAVLLVLVAFLGVPSYIRSGRGDVLTRFFAGFALWIRDEMVTPVMGKELGNKLLPFFLCLFFFILFMNLMGLVPGSATATASIFVTGALALITLLSMVFGGMFAQGPIAFWKNLVPHVPLALWPLMFVVELIGLVVKPFALMIRLFANMTGGHLVVLSFMGLIFFFADMGPAVGYGVSPIAVAFAVFIMIIEVFVAMLQAYIFTQLSILFIHASVHPEH